MEVLSTFCNSVNASAALMSNIDLGYIDGHESKALYYLSLLPSITLSSGSKLVESPAGCILKHMLLFSICLSPELLTRRPFIERCSRGFSIHGEYLSYFVLGAIASERHIYSTTPPGFPYLCFCCD